MAQKQPPRPVAVGDVVAVHSEALGAWTASQITGVDAATRSVAVLALDWSGPEPGTVADLGDVGPLRLTHHSWGGALAHCNHGWVVPRSFTVIGSLPPLVTAPSPAWSPQWGRGEQLARQRRWDAGDREDRDAPYALTCSASEVTAEHGDGAPRTDVRHLRVHGITRLDCARLVACFPALTRLSLSGTMGTLTSAAALNRLPWLQGLSVRELFGMEASDCLLPRHVPKLEQVRLYGIPAEYAKAMREAWRPQERHGVQLDVHGARSPEWVAANAANPLRDWDGREHIPRAVYREVLARYRAAREAFLTEVHGGGSRDRVTGVGHAFGTALNALDSRWAFIETVEREELFDALGFLVDEARRDTGRDLGAAREALFEGVESVRDW
ncbi:hypothetical protein [Streptomyces sp. NPDC002640]